MDTRHLKRILEKEPKYRLRQAKDAIYKKLISDWNLASNLPKDLIEKLNKEFPLQIKAQIQESDDKKTIKSLITLADGLKIEAVLMRHSSRNIVCVSTQVGCALACEFCLTGEMGFKRNLESHEIINQVLFFERYLKENFISHEKVTNIVFMGMGEPFLNYENLINSIKIMHDQEIFNLGWRRFSISTVGIPNAIKKFADENIEVNLAFSLHSPNNILRESLIPFNKKFPIEKVFEEINYYIKKTGRKVMLEYLMIKGVNDSEIQARELVNLIKNKSHLFVVNLIEFNSGRGFESSEKSTIKKFRNILERSGVSVTQRFKMGRGINAACGQLAGQ